MNLAQLNAEIAQPKGHNFSLTFRDTNSLRVTGVSRMLELVDAGAVAVVGDLYSDMTMSQAYAIARNRVFQCTGSATSDTLSNKAEFPYVYRTVPTDSYQAVVMLRTLQHLGWTGVNVISATSSYGTSLLSTFNQYAAQYQITSYLQTRLDASPKDADVQAVVQQLADSPSRVIVTMADVDLLYRIATEAARQGLNPQDWVWLASETVLLLPQFLGSLTNDTAPANSFLQGILGTSPLEQDASAARYQTLVQQWKATYNNSIITDQCVYCFFFHACLEASVRGVVALADKFGTPAVLARTHNATLADFLVPFDSATGPVRYSASGDRLGLYQIINLQGAATQPVLSVAADLSMTPTGIPIVYTGGKTAVKSWRTEISVSVPSYSSPGVIVLLTVSALSAVLVIGTFVYLFTFRKSKRVRHIGVPFLMAFSVGLVANLLSPFVWADIPTEAGCTVSSWLAIFGSCMTLSALGMKAFRIVRIYDNRILANSKSLGTRHLLARMVILPLAQIAMFIVSATVAPSHPTSSVSKAVMTYACTSTKPTVADALAAVAGCADLVLLLANVYLATKIRRTHTTYLETSFIAMSIHHLTLTVAIAVSLLLLLPVNAVSGFYIKSVAVVYPNLVAFYAMTLRHVHLVRREAIEDSDGTIVSHHRDAGSSSNSEWTASGQASGSRSTAAKSITGKFAMKRSNRFFANWEMRSLTVVPFEGVILVGNPNPDKPSLALAIATSTVTTDVPEYPMCIVLSHRGTDPLLVQFVSELEQKSWLTVLGKAGVVARQSQSGSRSSGSGGKRSGPVPQAPGSSKSGGVG
ncbi:hypothetical protein H9P43_009173 [Blastocladiella emersonii ATCC 22665]|nr:hypothetical protein H9P43_009173 [Blastocladiella emersonii ATCC 22665]